MLLQRLILGSTMRAWPTFPSALAHHDQVRRDSDPNPKRQRGKPPGFGRHGPNAAEHLAGASGLCVASRSKADATVRRLPEVMVEISVKSRIFGAVLRNRRSTSKTRTASLVSTVGLDFLDLCKHRSHPIPKTSLPRFLKALPCRKIRDVQLPFDAILIGR